MQIQILNICMRTAFAQTNAYRQRFWFAFTKPHTHTTHAGANVPCHCFVFILLCFCHRRTPAMIGCSFVANRDYFGELGLLDSGMDVYGGENIELGIRVCVSPSFLLFLLPLYPCRFKWSNGHSSVAPLINEAPLRVLEGQSCVCSSQQGCGNK